MQSKDHNGLTPLHNAVQHGHVPIIRLLLDHRANPNPVSTNDKHDTPLCIAVKKRQIPTIKLLFTHGAQVNLKGKNNKTLLHFAVEQHCSRENESTDLEIIQILLLKSADYNIKDDSQKTPLDYAIEQRNWKIVKLLRNSSKTPKQEPVSINT